MSIPGPWGDDVRETGEAASPADDPADDPAVADWRKQDDAVTEPVGRDRFGDEPAAPGAATAPAPPAAPSPGDATASRRPAKRRRPTSRIMAEYGILAVFAIVLAFLIRTFVGLAFYIPSESMVPTLKVHDRVIVSRISYHLHDPRRGDVVVFDNPNFDEKKVSFPRRILRDALGVVGINQPKDKNLIKRVVGLPGETVEGRDGHVWVNGKQLPEKYLPEGVPAGDFAPVAIPEGRVWVMGDNRGNSADSRFFGTIERKAVVGRAFVRIWPPWRMGLL